MMKTGKVLSCVFIFMLFSFSQGCAHTDDPSTLQTAASLDVAAFLYGTDFTAVCFTGNPYKWHLESITCYDANGQYKSRDQYTLDENNKLWKQSDDGKQYPVTAYDSEELWKAEEIGITTPEYDSNGILIRQISHRPSSAQDSDSSCTEEFGKSYGYSMISNEARLTSCVSWTSCRYGDRNTLSQMEITALDSVGSGTCFQVWGEFYISFHADGTPQFIAQKHDASYSVVKPDSYGRPVWIAWYDSAGNLQECYVYKYKTM